MHAKRIVVVLAVILLLAAAGTGHCQLWLTNYQFIAAPGYYNGGTLYYLMTDASTAFYANLFRTKTGFNVNYSPLLANALDPALRDFWDYPGMIVYHEFMPSLYYVTNFDQNLVFSAQWPVPPPTPSPAPPPAPPLPIARYSFNSYMPLWRLKLVTWTGGETTTLTSESQILTEQTAGHLSVTDAGVVVGASIMINTLGAKIPQASVSTVGGMKQIRLTTTGMYVNNLIYKSVTLDFSNSVMAQTKKGNFAPWLSRFNLANWVNPVIPPAYQPVYWFWPVVPPYQLLVATQVENPLGPTNANANYTPLMQQYNVTVPSVYTTYKSAGALAAYPKSPTGQVMFAPILGQ